MIKFEIRDNLELLITQQNGSVDCIYCDILFNTKNNFNDFADNLGTPAQAIEFYKPRFIEMHRVLSDSGLLYIHCDYNLSHYIKILLDEIFRNF